MNTTNHEWARTYADRYGWSLLPIWWVNDDGSCGCGDAHVEQPNNIGKHPIATLVPEGFKDASPNLDVIDSWWTRFPEANVAVACDRSGLVVIDVDPRHGGDLTWAGIVHNNPGIPDTLRAATGGGGFHYFFRSLPGQKFKGKLGAGVDVKHSGYVLLAPSSHASGGGYAWDTSGVPVVSPGVLLPLIEQGREPSASRLDNESRLDVESIFEGVPTGQRHETFVSYVASLRARSIKYPEAKALVELAVDRADGDFPMTEAMRILDDMWDRLPEGTSDAIDLGKYRGYLASQPTTADLVAAVDENIRDMVLEELKRMDVRRQAREIMDRLDDDDENEGRPSRLINAVEFCQLEDPPWLVEGLLPPLGLCMPYGPYGQGKSYIKLDLALSLANESVTTWFGHPINLHGDVVFVLMEGKFRFKNRIQAWLRAHPGTDQRRLWILAEKSLDLSSEASVKRLARDIAALGINPVMVVIDTQGQALANVDENGASGINAAYRNVRHHLVNGFDCLVSLVHHTGHDESRERGSSAQGGAVDAKFIVNKNSIVFDKVKAGPDRPTFYFELADVPEVADVFVRQVADDNVLVHTARKYVAIEQRVIAFVAGHPGCSLNEIKTGAGGNGQDIGERVKALIAGGRLVDSGSGSRRRISLSETHDGPAVSL